MAQVTTAQQLKKVMGVSRTVEVVLQIGIAFTGIGMAMTLIALVFASSFQLNLGNGDLGVTFFTQGQGQVIANIFEGGERFGAHVDTGLPDSAQVTRLMLEASTLLRVVTGALMFLQFAIIMLVLTHLAQLFALYARGSIFTSASVAHIRRIGLTLLALPVLSLLNSLFAAVLVARLTDGGVADSLHISLHMTGLFAAIVVLLISWIMDVGRALREENELTI